MPIHFDEDKVRDYQRREGLRVLPERPSTLHLSQNTRGVEVLNLAAGPSPRRVISFVRDFDPRKHPRGYKGMFIETPDKKDAGNAKVGDVIATKTGKVFQVTGHGNKGIKVASVDPDTGQVLDKGTVVANNIEVAVVVGGRGIGTKHEIGSLDPDTIIQHPRSGKRFKISKHGNWTTVYPVDDQGEVNGKHTVLPKETEVVIAPKVNGGHVTPQTVQKVTQHQTAAAASATKAANTFEKGDKATYKGEEYEVVEVLASGKVKVQGGNLPIAVAVDPAELKKVVPEQIPQGLKKPPTPYAPGVGKNTAVVIREVRKTGHYGKLEKPEYELHRVADPNNPNGPSELLGTFAGIGAARSTARKTSGAHEAVLEVRDGLSRDETRAQMAGIKKGDWFVSAGRLYQADADAEGYSGSTTFRITDTNGRSVYVEAWKSFKVNDITALNDFHQRNVGGVLENAMDIRAYPTLQTALDQHRADTAVVRAARPNLYIDALRHDFDPSTLVGQSKGDALAALRKLGYDEILPREPNLTKYINGRGQRLHLANKDGKITSVDVIKTTNVSTANATGFHKQLAEVLASGGDVRSLNPAESGNPEEAHSHTRQLLYDMALGKQNGIEALFKGDGQNIKVKSDAAYRTEIQSDTAWVQRARTEAAQGVQEPGLNAPVRADVMSQHWPDKTVTAGARSGQNAHVEVPEPDIPEQGQIAIAIGERNGMAEFAKAQYGTNYDEAVKRFASDYAAWKVDPSTGGPLAGKDSSDYIMTTLADVEARGKRQWELRTTELTRRAEALYEQKLTDETAVRRKSEGTVAVAPGSAADFQLPLWDDIEMEEQDLGEVESLAQNGPRYSQVPFFFTGGLLRDGMAYAMAGEQRIEAKTNMEMDRKVEERLRAAGSLQSMANNRHPSPPGRAVNRTNAGTMYRLTDPNNPRKYIDWVPHGLNGQTAPTNQRGRLTLYGYSPEEAAERMKDLGLVHEADEKVPFTSIMRSKRRYGVVTPLHSDYVSGDAPLPKIPASIHTGVKTMSHAETMLNGGGLLAQAERFKVGINVSGTIAANDVRGGVDHVVFAGMGDAPSFYGVANGGVDVVMKDTAFLRRDILLTDRNFTSGGDTRYPSYRDYHNRQRRAAGVADTNQNAYRSVEPAARQKHIDARNTPRFGYAGSNQEWNLGGGVPIEDMKYIVVGSQANATAVKRILDRLQAEGRVSEVPEIKVGFSDYYQMMRKDQGSGRR